MNKFYYTVTKQLDNVDGFEETNGYKDISVYRVKNNELVKVLDLELENTESTYPTILEELESKEIVKENDLVELILL